MVTWNKTKIIATVGPASNNRKTLRNMLLAGVDIFRLNGAHGTIDEHRKTIGLIRGVAGREDFPAAILLDLPGPKIRVGSLKTEPIYLKAGATVCLHCGKSVQTNDEIPIPMKQVAKSLKTGSKIYLNDGIIELKVLNINGCKIECRVRAGGKLMSHKGINLPHAKLAIPSLMPKDRALLNMAAHEGVDYVGLSFVRSAANILALKRMISRLAPEIKVIAKIEKPEALDDIDNIIRVSDAIMVARGDLGIEVPLEKVPVIQKDLLTKCHLAGKPSITATQMLESMVEEARPTRAEATDVANAVWEGSDAIMLSEETSMGKYPSQAVKAMADIALEAEKRMPILKSKTVSSDPATFQAEAISGAAGLIAKTLKAKAIVTPTRSGRTALLVSKLRPATQILAPTDDEGVARRMSLHWGVRPMIMPKRFSTVDETLKYAEKVALESKFIKSGDTIVITSGAHGSRGDITRLVEVRKAGEA